MQIVIAGEVFDSKAAVTRRVQVILKTSGQISQSDEPFVRGLLQRHRSVVKKTGAGISRIVVEKVPPWNNCHGFLIERVDGSRTDFSYKECLDPSTSLDKFKAACRTAVVPQTLAAKDAAFRLSRAITCPLTGEPITWESAHVDHAEPWTFQIIVESFIRDCNVTVERVSFGGSGDGETFSSFADPLMERMFAEYHRLRAVLQVMSRTGNLSVRKRRTPA